VEDDSIEQKEKINRREGKERAKIEENVRKQKRRKGGKSRSGDIRLRNLFVEQVQDPQPSF
jgi:hypothetical protein